MDLGFKLRYTIYMLIIKSMLLEHAKGIDTHAIECGISILCSLGKY